MYLWCNESCARALNIKSEEIEGKSDYNFYSKKDAEQRIADEKKIMEIGKVKEFDQKYKEGENIVWLKEILIPLKDGSNEPSGILGISWDTTNEKSCELEKEKLIKEMEEAISLLTPLFNNLSQGKLDEKVELPEGENNFNELFNIANLASDKLKQLKDELQNEINQKNEELTAGRKELNKITNELEQEKEINNQKEKELEQERQKVSEINNQLEENKRKHKEFVMSMLQDLEEKIKRMREDKN